MHSKYQERLEGGIALFVTSISPIEDDFVLWKILISLDRICKPNIFKMVTPDEVLSLYATKRAFNYNLYLNTRFLYATNYKVCFSFIKYLSFFWTKIFYHTQNTSAYQKPRNIVVHIYIVLCSSQCNVNNRKNFLQT